MKTAQSTIWFKSSHSGTEGGQCVEVALAALVHIRDSKAVAGPVLTVSRDAWTGFLALIPPAHRD
ncbi:DUF397 domain-containing protein [Streptomyces sp. AD55]|uniref:DUF397 domain-containing protein n=1 Tax=Streptomyces sp. AD55 TaxID=3242895 RepID=UPI0035272994